MKMSPFLLEVFFKYQSHTLCGECGLGKIFIVGFVVAFEAYTFTILIRKQKVLEFKISDKVGGIVYRVFSISEIAVKHQTVV